MSNSLQARKVIKQADDALLVVKTRRACDTRSDSDLRLVIATIQAMLIERQLRRSTRAKNENCYPMQDQCAAS